MIFFSWHDFFWKAKTMQWNLHAWKSTWKPAHWDRNSAWKNPGSGLSFVVKSCLHSFLHPYTSIHNSKQNLTMNHLFASLFSKPSNSPFSWIQPWHQCQGQVAEPHQSLANERNAASGYHLVTWPERSLDLYIASLSWLFLMIVNLLKLLGHMVFYIRASKWKVNSQIKKKRCGEINAKFNWVLHLMNPDITWAQLNSLFRLPKALPHIGPSSQVVVLCGPPNENSLDTSDFNLFKLVQLNFWKKNTHVRPVLCLHIML